MLKTLGIIALVLVLGVAGVLAYAATKPDTLRVSRSLTVNAPPEKLFVLVNDFRSWGAWSPYEKKDPAMQRTFGAITLGKGASYAWDGNKDIGKGSMEIVEVNAPSKIAIKLDFEKPFEAHNIAEFAFTPQGGATNVTWSMHGPALFIGKVIGVFIDMDKMIGRDFEDGLKNLKTLAEK